MAFPLANLRTFEAAARLLSFTLAADELHLSQSAVSQQIKQLEMRLGFKVFSRMTRRLELSDQGRQLFESVRRALHDLDLTVEILQGKELQGRVVVSAGSSFSANWLIPRLGRFRDAYPSIELQILPSDGAINLANETSIDLVVRFGNRATEDMIVERLGEDQVYVAASPALLRNMEPPREIADLARFTLLHNEASKLKPGASGDWGNWLAALGAKGVLDIASGPRFARSDLVVRAAVHAQGVALVWDTMVLRERAEKQLVKVFDGLFETRNSYVAWCTPQAFSKPKVHSVMEWLRLETANSPNIP